jgi:hypothetical protein
MKQPTTNAGPEGGRPSINWTASAQCDWEGIHLLDSDGLIHATITGATPEALALIKAAPELLDTLRAVCEAFEAHSPCDLNDIPADDAIEMMKRAIEAAEDSASIEAEREFDGALVCDKCGESYAEGGDGWNGLCGTCADKKEGEDWCQACEDGTCPELGEAKA